MPTIPVTTGIRLALSRKTERQSHSLSESAARLARGGLASLLLCASALSSAQPTLSGSPDQLREFLYPRPNTVNINGEAELTAYKDVAKVSLLVVTEARNLADSMSANEELRQGLIERFVAAGIPREDINNARFASSPQNGLFGRNSFAVTARLEVSVQSESHLQLLAAAADSADEVTLQSTEFEHSEEDAFEDRVRELALADVMEQKAFYEQQLGLRLRAVNFFYGGIQRTPRAMPLMARAQAADSAMAESSVSAAASTASSFDKTDYRTNVTVVFEIVSESSSTSSN
jgi:uncharacterized protein YggE